MVQHHPQKCAPQPPVTSSPPPCTNNRPLSQLAFFFVGHYWTDFSLVNRGSLAGVELATFIFPSSKGSHCATTGLCRSRRQVDSYFIAYERSSFVCGKLPYHGHLITRVPRNWLKSVSIFGMTVFWVTLSLKLCVLRLQNFRIFFLCYHFSLFLLRKSTIKSTFVASCGCVFDWPLWTDFSLWLWDSLAGVELSTFFFPSKGSHCTTTGLCLMSKTVGFIFYSLWTIKLWVW